MVFSDAIYGKAPRYVSRERLNLMLDHEYKLLVERLSATRGDRTNFFVFADTVATSNYQGTNEAHGWLGFRFQTEPKGEPSEIVLHARMWDKEAVLQQQALGIVGVNLIYAALYYRSDLGEADRVASATTSAATGSRSTCSASRARRSRTSTTG